MILRLIKKRKVGLKGLNSFLDCLGSKHKFLRSWSLNRLHFHVIFPLVVHRKDFLPLPIEL